LTLLVVVGITLIVTRLAAMALTLTGMSHEAARFQARSALATVGFTTNEAEAVVNHPVRRRIIMALMLTGSIGVPTVIATVVVSLLTTTQTEHWWEPVGVLVTGLLCLTVLARSKWVEKHLNTVMSWALRKWTSIDVRDYISLLQLENGYAVTEMLLDPGDWLEGKRLNEAALAREGVLILAIFRQNGQYIGAPLASDTMNAGDILILYGQMDRLRELDQRTAATGDRAHEQAVRGYAQARSARS
jgi:Trk K+ transport system NAD-binding subunit